LASKKQTGLWRYVAVVAGCFVLGLSAGWLSPAKRIDNYAYDELSGRAQPDWQPQSVVVAIDEDTLGKKGGMSNIREIEREAIDAIALGKPVAVATDVILADASIDPAQDDRLAESMRAVQKLILACDIPANGRRWEDPLPLFQALAAAEPGHVERMEHPLDGVTRQIPLERIVPGARRWALSLQALAVTRGQSILETPEDIEVGDLIIPAPRVSSRALKLGERG
jgi:CHASE2 domain-containing sensor protein